MPIALSNILSIFSTSGAIETSPLDVQGNVNLIGTSPTPQYLINGVPISFAPAGSNGQVQWNNNGAFGASAGLAWDYFNNVLSIDSTAPTSLTLTSSNIVQTAISLNNSSAGGRNYVVFTSGSSNSLVSAGAFGVWDSASGIVRLTISGTGQIGINQPNPAYALDVNGDINTTGIYRVNGAPLVAGSTGQIQFNWAGAFAASPSLAVDASGNITAGALFIQTNNLRFQPPAPQDANFILTGDLGSYILSVGSSLNTIGPNSFAILHGGSVVLGINPQGFVSIGNQNPLTAAYALDVNGSINLTDTLFFSSTAGGSDGVIRTAGATGILQIIADQQLQTFGPTITLNGTGPATGNSWSVSGNGIQGVGNTSIQGQFGVASASAILFFVDQFGRVGIDTYPPIYPLDVNGTARFSGNIITNLPTSPAGLPSGALWNNAGVPNIAP